MRTFSIFRLLILSIVILSVYSCSSDSDKDGVMDEKDHCPDVFAKTKDGCPVKKEIGNIHLYIETSASMGGYFKNDAGYKTIVSDLTAKVDKNIKPLDIWFIADSLVKYQKSVDQFSSDIATTKIADQKSSQLHKIISRIAAKTDSNDVSLLVSDCILSFPDADIKANPEINRTEAPNALKENIFSTFSDLKKKGFATIVYAFKSKFYGTYYDYQNVKTKMNGNSRPFYIWVIANKELVGKFETSLEDISTFKPEKSLHFGTMEEAVTKYVIIPQLERKGKWSKSSTGVADVEIEKDEPILISAAVNLEKLPAYARDVKYLQDNLKITNNGCDAKFEVKDKASVDKSKLKNEKQVRAFDDNTHVILLSVSAMSLSQADIHLNLPLRYDTWYMDWSTMDDKNILAQPNKTFALEHLINGVKEAYETKNKNYIDLSITLNK